MFGAQTPPLPTDLLERQLLPFLPVRSVLRLARCSKTCRAALSSDNGASIDELFWKERHRRRWKTSKASELTTVSTTSDNDGNAANDTQQQQVQGVPGIGKWHAFYKRRHELDATVRKKLRSPRHGAPPSEEIRRGSFSFSTVDWTFSIGCTPSPHLQARQGTRGRMMGMSLLPIWERLMTLSGTWPSRPWWPSTGSM